MRNIMKLVLKSLAAAALVSSVAFGATIATVNGNVIDSEEVNRVLMEGTQGRFSTLPAEQQTELRTRIIDGMISQELIYEDAKKNGIMNSAIYKQEMQMVMSRVEKQLAGKVWQEEQLTKISVTDKEKKDYYSSNKAEFVEKEKVHARHILLKDETKAKAITARLANLKGDALKEKFVEIAMAESTGPSAPKGGDLGYFAPGQMVPSFNDAVFSMKKGTITTTPVKSQFGYHIIYLEDKKMGKTLNYADVETFIDQRLKAQKFEAHMKTKMEELKKGAKITFAK
ncbi:MAG: peptidylprolyl isomerase [Campylobacterota bacterium]|nr:peptidylprolyl isomerase [Campylobacterota bacterium]